MNFPTRSSGMDDIHRSLCAALAACSLATMLCQPARAADASPWAEDSRSAIRLIAGENKNGEGLRAGIEIKLQPGWKTYWRYPGDSGVPPRFDFSGSENLKIANVLYPAPHLFTDAAGQTLGYKDVVTFPLQISPLQAGMPVRLRLKLDYAVCEKLCIPAEGRAELILGMGDSTHDAALTAAEARVPKLLSAADISLTVHRVNNGPKPLVFVDLAAPDGKQVEVFVEGPTPEWALPIPKPAQGAPSGHRHFAFELDGLPPGVDPKGRFKLTFTVVEDGRAIEVKTHLD
jgi:DsbC/DsbD-like thiol-disulfide interchange protein